MIRVIVLLLTVLGLIGCTHGNCRSQKQKDATKEVSMNQSSPDHVRVYKADGSLQCAMGKPISVVEMQKQLGEIQVFSATNKHDGMMRVQVCGAPTGNCNVYEIDRKDLQKALSLGFKEWVGE